MKHLLFALLLTLAACGPKDRVTVQTPQFDDSAIQNKLSDHEARIAALEALTGSLNFRTAALEAAQQEASSALTVAITNLRAELTLAISTAAATSTAELTAAVSDLSARITALKQAQVAQASLNTDFEARLAALEAVDPLVQADLDQALDSLRALLESQIAASANVSASQLLSAVQQINTHITDLQSRVLALEILTATSINDMSLLDRVTLLEQSQAVAVNLSSLGGTCAASQESLLKIGGTFVGVMVDTSSLTLQGTRCSVEVLGLCVIGGNGNNGSSTITIPNEVFLSQLPQDVAFTATDGSGCRFQINSSNQLQLL